MEQVSSIKGLIFVHSLSNTGRLYKRREDTTA